MRFSYIASLAGALLAGHSVATDGPYCPVEAMSVFGSNAGAACCGSVTRRRMHRPRWASTAEVPTCEGTDEPPCCTEKEAGPPVVESGGSTNLQCGSKYDPAASSHDVANAVSYEIEPCAEDPDKMCLHAKVEASSDATILDIHLNIGSEGDSLPSTALGRWPFNKYCKFSGTVGDCWVPLSAIEAIVPSHSICDSTVKVAFGIKVSYSGGGGDTCFGQGAPLDGKNWFMSSLVSFSCPDVCTQYCCCEPYTPPPPPPDVVCEVGSAYGYGPWYANFNGNPVSPALSPLPNSCKKWGFYFPLTPAAMAIGVAGTLHVGAGQNDLTKGKPVGTFTAGLYDTSLHVSYTLYNGFDLSEVHVYASCSQPTTCAPGQYTYTGSGLDLSGTADKSFSKSIGIAGAPCDKYYLIFHAKVNSILPAGSTCPPKVNDG